MECKYCKTYNKDDYVYCINCGRKLHSKDLKDTFSGVKGKLSPKILIAAAAVLLLVLGALFGAKLFSHKEAPYTLKQSSIAVVDENGDCYIFEGDVRKAKIDNCTLLSKRQSFDGTTQLVNVESEEGKAMYVYRDGKLNMVTDDFSNYLICDDGRKVLYIDDNDSVYIYDVRSKKRATVLSGEEPYLLNCFVLSPSGSHLAYTTRNQEEPKLFLYSSNGTAVYTLEQEVKGLVGVSEKGEIFFIAEDGSVRSCSNRGETVILDDYDAMYINKDFTQIALRNDNNLYFYKEGVTDLVCEEETAKVMSIVTPDNTQRETIIQHNNGKITSMVSHLGVDSFDEKYWSTAGNQIVTIRKNHTADILVDKTYNYIVTDDGGALYYRDDEGRIIRYSNGRKEEFYSGEEKAVRPYAWDSRNKGLYFTGESSGLMYSDGNNVSHVCDRYPEFFIFCNDGYVYFTDGVDLYTATKGQMAEVLDDTVGEYGEGLHKYDLYSRDGIFFEKNYSDIFFARNGKAKQIVLDAD